MMFKFCFWKQAVDGGFMRLAQEFGDHLKALWRGFPARRSSLAFVMQSSFVSKAQTVGCRVTSVVLVT